MDFAGSVLPGLEEVEEFAGVENVVGVKSGFDGGHGLEFGLGKFEVGEGSFGEADTVFSADGATDFRDFLHDLTNCLGGGSACLQCCPVIHDVDVEVAISGVTKDGDGKMGILPNLINVFDKVGLLTKWDNYVLIELGIRQHEHGGGAFAADLPEVFSVFSILCLDVIDTGSP